MLPESIEGRRARAAAIRQEAANTILRPEMRGGNSAF